jgi:hypothetical protein
MRQMLALRVKELKEIAHCDVIITKQPQFLQAMH